jgi:S-(hydroxymethyl)glutathione dehydrogenase / alcohol dehydrogenase
MKAAVCYEINKPLVIEDVTLDPPGKGEVKVRITATAICHSDVHSFKGEHGVAKLPAIGGHEVAGIVDEVGEGVTSVKPGDHVIVSLESSGCGKCYYCTIGVPQRCIERHPRMRKPGHFTGLSAPGRYTNSKGQRLYQFGGPTMAGFVEYTVTGAKHLVKVPDSMPLDRAALLACGVMTGYGAVVHRAQVKPFSSVIVMGTGGVGLNAIQAARLSGADPIIGVDVLDSKLETAKLFGATHTINAKKEQDPVEAAYDLTSGRGADYVFICVGGMGALRQGFMMAGYRSMTVIIGHSGEDTLSAFEPTDFIGGERALTGAGMQSGMFVLDIPHFVQLYQEGKLKLDELITNRYKLEQINEALASSESGNALRNVIMFQ